MCCSSLVYGPDLLRVGTFNLLRSGEVKEFVPRDLTLEVFSSRTDGVDSNIEVTVGVTTYRHPIYFRTLKLLGGYL